jgi:hypothetical protein
VSEATAVTDEEIRDWARSTGKEVPARGRVGAKLRAEYEGLVANAIGDSAQDGDAAPGADAQAPGRGAESDSKAPGPAREETRPRKVRAGRGRGLRERLRGAGGGGRKSGRGRKTLPRVSTERLIERAWELGSRLAQPVNLPVARCLDWQGPTAGVLLEQAVKDTIVDKVIQPFARAEARLEIAGALIGPPLLVMALQLPQNQPTRLVERKHPETGQPVKVEEPWPLGAMRHQVIMAALEEALDMCVEAQQKLPKEVLARQKEREDRRAAMGEIIATFFAPPPASAAAAKAEEDAMARARDRFRGGQ